MTLQKQYKMSSFRTYNTKRQMHSTGQKPLCDRCDINYDRRDINDKVNQINLYFQTVYTWLGCWFT